AAKQWPKNKVTPFLGTLSEPQDWHTSGRREMAAFSSCVLRPLEWAGFLIESREDGPSNRVSHLFKSPLWCSVLKLDTNDMLRPISVQ
ncbi:hypothetical protein V5299_16280, partial [Celeribacter halophilus]